MTFFSILLWHDKTIVDCTNEKGYTPLFYAAKVGALSNIIELLEHGANVNHIANKCKTPLFKARSPETAMLLLRYGADPNKTIDTSISGETKSCTAIEYLMKFNAGCPTAILDECLMKQSDDTLIMDFNVFESSCTYEKTKFITDRIVNKMSKKNVLLNEEEKDLQDNEMSLFIAAKRTKRSSVLLHPLMQIFLGLKFTTVEGFFVLQVLFDLIITFVLTRLGIIYVDLSNCNIDDDGMMFNAYVNKTIKNGTMGLICVLNTFRLNDSSIPEHETIERISKALGLGKDFWSHHWLLLCAYVMLGIFLAREVYQLIRQGLREYSTSLENCLEMLISILAWAFIGLSNTHMDIATHCAAWTVFLAWIDLIMFLGKFDTFGTYIFMSVDVTKTMLFCLSTYIPSFLAFSFGFYILLKPSDNFKSYTATIVKVLSMMVGDISYDDDFSYHAVMEKGARNISTQFMFVFFLVSIMMIIMNLLLAVTVSSTDHLMERAQMMLAKRRVEDVIISTDVPDWLMKMKLKIEDMCSKSNISWLKKFINRKKPILKRCVSEEGGLRNYKVLI